MNDNFYPSPEPVPMPASWSVVRGGRATLGPGAVFGVLDDLISRVAETSVTVLIRGERGTGKELAARAIHARSGRASRAFVKVNCRAPAAMLETELFGCERGAMPGAVQDRPGRLEFANRGTLYLEEVSELPGSIQGKLLKVLRDGGTSRLGGSVPIRVDVRLVAATEHYLEQAVLEGRFDRELFVRLNAVCLTLPPLRQRRTEIPDMVRYFVAQYAERFNKPALELTEATLRVLKRHDWPGNVAELESHVRRMVSEGSADIELEEPPVSVAPHPRTAAPAAPPAAVPNAASTMSLKAIARQAADTAGARAHLSRAADHALEPPRRGRDARCQLQGAAAQDQACGTERCLVTPSEPYLEDGSRVVTLEAFDFIFRNELKRAVRAQNFLTLLQLDTAPLSHQERAIVVRQLARLVSADVRETDLVAEGEGGRVWVLLLDTDLPHSMCVVDRLLARVKHYEFTTPTDIGIGVASCPTHGTDVESLKRAADVRPGRQSTEMA